MTAGFATQAAQTPSTGITPAMRTRASIETVLCGMNSSRFHNRPDAERFRLEEELRALRERLVHAHEQERVRVGRELHDDIGQRLSLLALTLSMLAQDAAQIPSNISGRLSELSRHAAGLASDLHRLSHELHPVMLQQLGLEAVIRGFCHEQARTRHIAIRLEIRQVPDVLRQEVALCLYRITQEALHNVVRHSGASSAMVRLAGIADGIALTVMDHGVGFDPDEPRVRASLGLTSMLERIRLVDGRLLVHSKRGEGTRIEAHVPLRVSK
jgi:signal transduction histidine kinase